MSVSLSLNLQYEVIRACCMTIKSTTVLNLLEGHFKVHEHVIFHHWAISGVAISPTGPKPASIVLCSDG